MLCQVQLLCAPTPWECLGQLDQSEKKNTTWAITLKEEPTNKSQLKHTVGYLVSYLNAYLCSRIAWTKGWNVPTHWSSITEPN